MTAYLTKTIRQAGIVLAFAVSFSALSATSSFAYSSEAPAVYRRRLSALQDDEIPNISKITACMMKKRASLSTGCRAVMDRNLWRRSRARSPRSDPCYLPPLSAFFSFFLPDRRNVSQKTLRRRFERIRTHYHLMTG